MIIFEAFLVTLAITLGIVVFSSKLSPKDYLKVVLATTITFAMVACVGMGVYAIAMDLMH
jgi:hypothetical protein